MSLYPTKTRLALLRDVRDGVVLDLIDDTIDPGQEIPTWNTAGAEDGFPARRVTAAITAMCREGWVTLGSDHMTWRLTDKGRAVLRDAP
ncbi:MAG TPA: hypothetical protein VFY84_19520 [Jiangellales bacterium]|nr:hypothetical protein [Jiangellales bacterium]